MHIPRLSHLIHILRAVNPERFNMERWTNGEDKCPVGYAMFDPAFAGQGFSSVIRDGYAGKLYYKPIFKDEQGTREGLVAVLDFFDITPEQHDDLFVSDSYWPNPTPSDVVDRIAKLIANQG